MKPAMPPQTRKAFIMLLHRYGATASPPKDFLDLESINVMVATQDDCIADKRMTSDARLLTLRPCLNQNSPVNDSARDGFLGRRRGVAGAVGVSSPYPSTLKPAARNR